MKYYVRVPATSANLGPGFDCMGLALDVYNEMSVETGHPFSIEITGESANLLPTTRENAVVQAMEVLFERAGNPAVEREWKLTLENHIPVASGLGSSASAIVGGLLLANELVIEAGGQALSHRELLDLAVELEGHPDNVAPALTGGASLSYVDDHGTHTFAIPVPDNLYFVVAVPYFTLHTEQSRTVVPPTVTRADAVFNIAQASRLTLALCTGNLELLRGGFSDRLHEPYRRSLVPGYDDVRHAALRSGALALTLSGAGPSLLAWCTDEVAAWQVADQMTLSWRENGIPCRTEVYRPCLTQTVAVREDV
ncbi:homoserine kinase [Alicyclobacillus sp. ALC3]|uniref:homoserine kinase n=1 Tax=Alicyclobacillus sp. ALC3 TaxID=2796143 RepID=UPI002377E3A6|nr:homoserine kinase [Alicyclobacillus sp. ALC3]WDL95438.1 homoserine kinase [Alicyclobacillus sp. ALC3]